MSFPYKNKRILFLFGLAGLVIFTAPFVGCFWQGNNVNSEDDADSSKFSRQRSRDYYSPKSPLYRGIILDRAGAVFAVSRKKDCGLARPSEYKRVYPCGSLASPVLGFIDHGGRGLEGVEYTYNSLLSHTNISLTYPGGQELILTLEKDIQALAERELDRQLRRLKADKGCLVIMSVENGEILAMASKPSWDPGRFWELPATNITNYSLQDDVDPIVLVTLLSWMFEQSEQPKSKNQSPDRTACKCKWETLDEGVVLWSPWTGQELKDLVSYDGLSRDLWGLGFGQTTGIDLPAEGQGSLSSVLPGLQNCLLYRGITASPIQILRAFSALINGNILVTPHLALQKGRKEFPPSESSVKDQRQVKVPWLTEELMLRSRKNLAVRSGPSLASIRWNGQAGRISIRSPAQVTVLGFWPDRSPKVSYIGFLDGVKIDPRERRGTLGRALLVVKQAAQIPLNDEWQTAKSKETKKDLSMMPNLKGKSARQAMDILQSIGLSIKLKGAGTVVAQKPRSGMPLKGVKVCNITCK